MTQKIFCHVLITLLIGSGIAHGQEVISGSELGTVAKAARDFVPRDEFERAPSTPTLAGRRFAVLITPRAPRDDSGICSGFPGWGYDTEKGVLFTAPVPGTIATRSLKPRQGSSFAGVFTESTYLAQFHGFECSIQKLPSYVASNALGAQFTIEKSNKTVTAIGQAGLDMPMWQMAQISLEPDVMRQLATHLRFRFSGTLTDWTPGKSVICGLAVTEPRADRPIDETTDICLFQGKFDRFEILDVRDGRILHSQSR